MNNPTKNFLLKINGSIAEIWKLVAKNECFDLEMWKVANDFVINVHMQSNRSINQLLQVFVDNDH